MSKQTQQEQNIRLKIIVDELKRNQHISVPELSKIIHKAARQGRISSTCCERTIYRDIEALKIHHHAPIESHNDKKLGYFLADRSWEFTSLIPDARKCKVQIDHTILNRLLDASKQRRIVEIDYTTQNNVSFQAQIEPHFVGQFKDTWYLRGKINGLGLLRTYAVQRISYVRQTKQTFKIDKQLVADAQKGKFFDFPMISDIQLLVDPAGAYYFCEREKTENYHIIRNSNGSLLVTLPPTTEEDAIRYVLNGIGRVTIIKPDYIRQYVQDLAKHLYFQHEKLIEEKSKSTTKHS